MEQSIKFPAVGSVDESFLRPFAVRINNDGTNAESIDRDDGGVVVDVDEDVASDGGGGIGSKNGCCSDAVGSFKGELATDEAADEDGVFDSIEFEGSLG